MTDIKKAQKDFQLSTLKYATSFSKTAKKADTKSSEVKNKLLFNFAEKFLEPPFKKFVTKELIKDWDKLPREIRLTYVIGIFISINSSKLKNQADTIFKATIDEIKERIQNES